LTDDTASKNVNLELHKKDIMQSLARKEKNTIKRLMKGNFG